MAILRAARVAHGQSLLPWSRALFSLPTRNNVVPSFTLTSRRYDHSLASQKSKNHESNDSESDIVSDTSEDARGPAFGGLKTKVNPDTLRAITSKPLNHTHMSPVQAAVLPLLPELARPHGKDESDGPPRDLLVKAKTGTGKTLAFLVPAIEARIKAIDKAGVDALEGNNGRPDAGVVENAKRAYAKRTVGTVIISPTRELATQIAHEAVKLTHWHKDFEVNLFTGGSSKSAQLREFKRGRRDIVVATPGRIRDVLENEPDVAKVLRTANHLVLDEGDTLLDMGFRPDIDAIIDFFPRTPTRQTFLFSATVSSAIRQIARSVLDEKHAFIDVVSKDSSPVHAHIPQHFTVLPSAREQLPHLVRLIAQDQLASPGNSKIMVFLNTTKQTQLFATLLRQLSRTTLPARPRIYEIHSKRTQSARTATSDAFRHDSSGAAILVTSDVSARGIDYPGVTRIIQVGSPTSTEQYIHRVGRTGRAGKGGRVDLLLLPFEQNFVRYQLSDVPIKQLSHDQLLDEVTALAEKLENDPAAFRNSAKEAKPRSNEFAAKDQRFIDKPATALADLNTKVAGLLEQVDREAIEEVFVSLLGFYFSKAGDLRVSRRSMYEALQAWTTEACGLPKAPFVSDALLARMGGLDGTAAPPAFSQRRSQRSSFGLRAPATKYGNSDRNRRWNERTDREVGHARGRRGEDGDDRPWARSGSDSGSGSGSRWMGRGSRPSRDAERRGGEWRKSSWSGRSRGGDDGES